MTARCSLAALPSLPFGPAWHFLALPGFASAGGAYISSESPQHRTNCPPFPFFSCPCCPCLAHGSRSPTNCGRLYAARALAILCCPLALILSAHPRLAGRCPPSFSSDPLLPHGPTYVFCHAIDPFPRCTGLAWLGPHAPVCIPPAAQMIQVTSASIWPIPCLLSFLVRLSLHCVLRHRSLIGAGLMALAGPCCLNRPDPVRQLCLSMLSSVHHDAV